MASLALVILCVLIRPLVDAVAWEEVDETVRSDSVGLTNAEGDHPVEDFSRKTPVSVENVGAGPVFGRSSLKRREG